MTDPISATDPAMIAGLIAALGCISLALWTKRRGMATIPTEPERELWMTQAAGVVSERSADLLEAASLEPDFLEPDLLDTDLLNTGVAETAALEPASIDLRPAQIDITEHIDITEQIDITELDAVTHDDDGAI